MNKNVQQNQPPKSRLAHNFMKLSVLFLVVMSASNYTASHINFTGVNVSANATSSLIANPNQPEMMLIPAGSVNTPEPFPAVLSANDVHVIKIAEPFYMGKHEITFSQWDECVKHEGCSYKPDDNQWGRGNRPVINISWRDIEQYLAWLSSSTGREYRLPTELEWEYAARAGSSDRFGPPPLFSDPKLAWASSYVLEPVQSLQTKAVNSGTPNAFGLFGIRGNVWEWTATCFQSNSGSKESCGIRILRGEHRSYMPNFLREIGTGGCAVKPLPGNFGFRVVSPVLPANRFWL